MTRRLRIHSGTRTGHNLPKLITGVTRSETGSQQLQYARLFPSSISQLKRQMNGKDRKKGDFCDERYRDPAIPTLT